MTRLVRGPKQSDRCSLPQPEVRRFEPAQHTLARDSMAELVGDARNNLYPSGVVTSRLRWVLG